MEENDLIAEAYQNIINEGFIDRAKGTAAGIGQSLSNAPKRVANTIRSGQAAYRGNAEVATTAAERNKNLKSGRQAKIEHVNNSHANKFRSAIDSFSKQLESLQSDYMSDAAKVGITQEMIQQVNVEILTSIANKLGITPEILKANEPAEETPPPLPKQEAAPVAKQPVAVPRSAPTRPSRPSGINTDDE